MQEKEWEYYSKLANWDFSQIKYKTEKLTNWDFYKKIRENTNEKSLCLDIGTGGGEKVLEHYSKVGMIIATDFSKDMIKTAMENQKEYQERNVKFAVMDNLEMKFPGGIFDLVSARHTIINAKQIYNCLREHGTLVIEGIDKKDCLEIKEVFGRGQGYNDKISISDKDYNDLIEAGFTKIERVEILENEYYETEEDLMVLLLKTPILNDFSKIGEKFLKHHNLIEKDLFNEYVRKNRTEKGILLKRRLYGIVAKK